MSALLQRLRAHIAQMAPHQRDREAGRLLVEAADWIEAREADDAVRTAKQAVNPFRELV